MDLKIKNAIVKATEQEAFSNTLGLKLVELDTGCSVVELMYEPERMNNLFNTFKFSPAFN